MREGVSIVNIDTPSYVCLRRRGGDAPRSLRSSLLWNGELLFAAQARSFSFIVVLVLKFV